MSAQRDFDLSEFDRQVDVELLAQEFGMTLRQKDSSALWKKYDAENGDIVIIKKRTNTWFVPSRGKGSSGGDDKGGAARLVLNYYAGGDWKIAFDKMKEVLNIPLEYKPDLTPENIKSAQFNDEKRRKKNWYIENKTRPLNEHPYLINDRLISPSLLKQPRFHNCIRIPTDDGYGFKNALAIHRDHKGICAYEKHNSTKSGNLNIVSTDSRKCLWYSDDVLGDTVERVFIGEAFIDALSFGTLVEKTDPNIALMSFGGKYDSGARCKKGGFNEDHYFIKTLRTIFDKTKAKDILLSCDNDGPGYEYDAFFADFFKQYYPDKFRVLQNKPPLHLNDWNDFLVAHTFNKKAKHLELAAMTKQAFFCEAGIGCFRIIKSQKTQGNTLITLPPSGFMTSKMKAVVCSFVAAMHKSDPHAHLVYTASKSTKSLAYAKQVEKFRREHLPNMNYRKTSKVDVLGDLKSDQSLKDNSILPDWQGYRQVVNHPHALADRTATLVLTRSDDDEVKYFHNNHNPVKMIVAVPGPDKLTKSHQVEIKLLMRDILRYREQGDYKVYFSPCDDGTGNFNNAHCEFFNNVLMELKKPDKNGSSFESEIDSLAIKHGKQVGSDATILEHLESQGLLRRSKSIIDETPEPVKKKTLAQPAVRPTL